MNFFLVPFWELCRNSLRIFSYPKIHRRHLGLNGQKNGFEWLVECICFGHFQTKTLHHCHCGEGERGKRKAKRIIIKSNSQNDPPTHGAELWKFKMIALFYEILINNAMRLHGICCMQNLCSHTQYTIDVVTHMSEFHNTGKSISIRIEIKHYVNGQWYVEKSWLWNGFCVPIHGHTHTHSQDRIKCLKWFIVYRLLISNEAVCLCLPTIFSRSFIHHAYMMIIMVEIRFYIGWSVHWLTSKQNRNRFANKISNTHIGTSAISLDLCVCFLFFCFFFAL